MKPYFWFVRRVLIIVALCAAQASTFAEAASSELREMAQLFAERFHSGYEQNQCGPNIMSFIKAAKAKRIDARNAHILHIQNEGFSAFGMVNAELARFGSGRRIPGSEPPRFEPGEKNWYHHVVLELDCHVFDFDFGSKPTVLPMAEYLERMFLNENPKPAIGFYVGREEKLKNYKITPYRVSSYFANPESQDLKPEPEKPFPLGGLLSRCRPK